MLEDPAIEHAAFADRRRIAAVLSAGCTALRLAMHHDVVGVDIDPAQVAYVRRRLDGAGAEPGVCDRLMASARSLAPLGAWTPDLVQAFLDLDDPEEQRRFWRHRLDTLRFRVGVDALFSRAAFRLGRLPAFVRLLPPGFGSVLRVRLARGFGTGSRSRTFSTAPARPTAGGSATRSGVPRRPAPWPWCAASWSRPRPAPGTALRTIDRSCGASWMSVRPQRSARGSRPGIGAPSDVLCRGARGQA